MRLALALLLLALTGCRSTPAHLAPEDDLAGETWTLVDQAGQGLAFPQDLAGRPVLLSAVYTHCPDVCLMTMANMQRVRRALGPDTARVAFATVSFDPRRDTPERLRDYAETWRTGPDWRLLTGDEAEVARLMDRLGVRVAFGTPDTLASGQASYLVDHSDRAFLLNARGQVVETYSGTATPPDMIAEDLRALLR